MYVTGNQAALEIDRRSIGGKSVVLVALPAFATSGVAILLNLRTLAVTPICFDTTDVEETKMEEEKEREEEDVVINEDMANEENEWSVCCKQVNSL